MEPEGTLPCPNEPATIPTRSRINPVHALPLHFFMISFTIILTSMPKCRNSSLPSGAPPNLFALLSSPQTYHLSRLSHSPRFFPHICVAQVLNVPFMLLSVTFSLVDPNTECFCYFLPRRSKYRVFLLLSSS